MVSLLWSVGYARRISRSVGQDLVPQEGQKLSFPPMRSLRPTILAETSVAGKNTYGPGPSAAPFSEVAGGLVTVKRANDSDLTIPAGQR